MQYVLPITRPTFPTVYWCIMIMLSTLKFITSTIIVLVSGNYVLDLVEIPIILLYQMCRIIIYILDLKQQYIYFQKKINSEESGQKISSSFTYHRIWKSG